MKIKASFLLFCLVMVGHVGAQPDLRVAAAANFADMARLLAIEFAQHSDLKVAVSSGSSGALFAQISQGAPFDVFLSADSMRPKRLEQLGMIEPGTRATYAHGQLALWSEHLGSRTTNFTESESAEIITELLLKTKTLAIANPDIAPYGLAAKQLLASIALWRNNEFRLVKGNSVLQAFQFKQTGNADSALIALHLLEDQSGFITVPNSLYQPIQQQLVIMNASRNKGVAHRFVAFILSDAVQKRLHVSGYQGGER